MANLPNLQNLSERELLLLAVQSLNTLTDRYDVHHEVLFGKGAWPGIRAQVTMLWLLAGGLWAIVLVVAAGTLKSFVG